MDSVLTDALISIEDNVWVGDFKAARDAALSALLQIPGRNELNRKINSKIRYLRRSRKGPEIREYLDSEFGEGGKWIENYNQTILRNRVSKVAARLASALKSGYEPITYRRDHFRFSSQSIDLRHNVRALFDSKIRAPEDVELAKLAASLDFTEPNYQRNPPSITIRMFSGEEYTEASFVERYGTLMMVQRKSDPQRVLDVAVALFALVSGGEP
jgi:hypothetical protein